MRFYVPEIRSAGTIEQTASLDPQIVLGQPPEFVDFNHPLEVKAKANLSSSDIVVTGQVKTTIGFVCARCLENFDQPVAADFQQVFGLDLNEFDIINDIREAVFIDLPLTPVCKQNCQGLCPSCGKNKNLGSCQCKLAQSRASDLGSKWDALKKFRYK